MVTTSGASPSSVRHRCSPRIHTPRTAPTKFGILIFPGFEPLDVFGPAEIIQTLSSRKPMSLYWISSSTSPALDPVSTLDPDDLTINPPAGIDTFKRHTAPTTIVPTHTLAAPPDDVEVLLVPGGLGILSRATEPAVAYLRAVHPQLKYVVSVCGGSALLARAGILEGRRATTNKAFYEHISTTYAHGIRWEKKPRWVVDGKVWTSGGVSAGIDMALGWVAHVWDEGLAREIANVVEYEWRNDPNFDVFAYVW
ncbi:class I glutamine amidotransferase-like protein [Epithele typhae]|uniref:class I glutamine amidotransferase-like protein n=1 Tax=Epithele typhae TaxID=378194 RepID=UPI002008A6C2|nr:class I glutamine amidotransferase-like protein [Epithele typhae]KAH9926568.1 class I glutamine amidotransferase-like protein [Epithele typhae]